MLGRTCEFSVRGYKNKLYRNLVLWGDNIPKLLHKTWALHLQSSAFWSLKFDIMNLSSTDRYWRFYTCFVELIEVFILDI